MAPFRVFMHTAIEECMMRSIADIFGPNTGYVLELYEQYINDPESVDPELRTWFAQNAQLL